MRVKNLHGTSDNHPQDERYWKDYWEARKGAFSYCSRTECLNKAEVGAHVIKVGSNSKEWYIVPLCRACNKLTTEFDVPADAMVRVNE